MTVSSAYIELFIRGNCPGGNVRGNCPDTDQTIELFNNWSHQSDTSNLNTSPDFSAPMRNTTNFPIFDRTNNLYRPSKSVL